MLDFPDFEGSGAEAKLNDLKRLADPALGATQYTDEHWAARFHSVLLNSYLAAQDNSRWSKDENLRRCRDDEMQLPLALAAIFDLASNIEYCRGRVVSANWIYCNRDDRPERRAYYSFLKQCPQCCLDRGLERRISGAQHKPSSHHIGEITTTMTTLMLRLFAAAAPEPLVVAAILKQSHDVDAIAWDKDSLVLFEIKSSPMVTFPLVTTLDLPLTRETSAGVEEYGQHSLVDIPLDNRQVALSVPHRDLLMDLGSPEGPPWPYPQATALFTDEAVWLDYFSAWLELFYAYSIPKRLRTGREKVLPYLVNGWGDEIDSNKTKPGLGRTDDLKKGTYQLLKFGAYYRDDAKPPTVRSALVANLDPLFLREEYLDKLEKVRWSDESNFVLTGSNYQIAEDRLHYLYEAIMALNRSVLNDPYLATLFDFGNLQEALSAGTLGTMLARWALGGVAPDAGAES
ncbi:MAG TPA: hypothetical protein VFX45_02510 [Solirubrobacterales bacterium]|nr:hypothetical protein [Solirubrobacterales bacterium]